MKTTGHTSPNKARHPTRWGAGVAESLMIFNLLGFVDVLRHPTE